MKRGTHRVLSTVSISVVLVVCTMILPAIALARAGGGGGGGGGSGGGGDGGGGGLLVLILGPFLLIYSAFISFVVASKSRETRALLARLQEVDQTWDLARIQKRVELTYFKVQEAWTARDQDIAKDYLSPRLYELHKVQTDQMIRAGRQNMLDRINLKQARVIGVKDFVEDSNDRFWVHIEGSMIDYMIDDATGAVLSGSPDDPEAFTEIWSFVRGDVDWVLDEINQKAGLFQIDNVDCYTEASPGDA